MARLPEGLSNDLWVEICDFTRQPALSRVCRCLWRLLQKRHHQLRLSGGSLPQWVVWCRDQVKTADLDIQGLPGGDGLATLRLCATLHTLTLNLAGSQVGAAGAQALATLKDCAALHTLILILSSNQVGDAGAQALAALNNSTALHTLSLDLKFNQLTDADAQALATLKDSTTLHTLRLNLSYNLIADAGAQALAQL